MATYDPSDRSETPRRRRSYSRRPAPDEVRPPEPQTFALAALFSASSSAAQPQERILICDASPAEADRLAQVLIQHGYGARIIESSEPERVERALREAAADLIVVDPGPGRGDHLLAFQQLARLERPLIVVSREAGDLDRVAGLEFGADDYVSKDIHPLEFLARVRAVLRRTRRDRGGSGAWTLAADAGTIRSPGGATLHLPAGSLAILKVLAAHPRELVSRERLMALTYGGRQIRPRSIDVRIRRLRAELREIGGEDLIHTSYRQGWALDADMVVA